MENTTLKDSIPNNSQSNLKYQGNNVSTNLILAKVKMKASYVAEKERGTCTLRCPVEAYGDISLGRMIWNNPKRKMYLCLKLSLLPPETPPTHHSGVDAGKRA